MQPSPDAPGHATSPDAAGAVGQLLRLLGVLHRRWLVWVATTGLCVVAAFESAYGEWARSLRYFGIWLVGPTVTSTWQIGASDGRREPLRG